MRNSVKYVITADNVDGEDYLVREFTTGSGEYWYPPLFKTEDNLPVNDCIEFADQEEGFLSHSLRELDTTKYFLECKKDCTISIDLTKLIIRTDISTEKYVKQKYLYIIKSDGSYKTANGELRPTNFTSGNITLEIGDKLQLIVLLGTHSVDGSLLPQNYTKVYIYSKELLVTWQGKIESVDVDCISLNTLLGKILSSISSDSVTLTGSICETINGVENERLKNTKIVAAESIRQMVGAKIYTSFKDFSAFMESVYGYVYEIIPIATEGYTEDSIVTFKHRSEVFADEVVKSIRIITEPRFCINKGLIYSALKIGYEKQDYENGNNGFDEFNFTNHYKTGTTLSTTTLELMCPYRADCYGFEQTAEKIGKSTESCDSDNDVFIVKVLPELTNDKYIIDRTLVIEGAFSNTVFNGTFAPPYMIEANKRYIASFCKELKFASSEGNSTIIIGGVPINSDIETNEPLFSVGEVAFKTNDFKLPKNFQGLIEFEWEGRKYQGYLADVEISYQSSGILEYKLLERQV